MGTGIGEFIENGNATYLFSGTLKTLGKTESNFKLIFFEPGL